MTLSLDTHAYDAKWRDRLISVNQADDAFFENASPIEQITGEQFAVVAARSSNVPGVIASAQKWRTQMLASPTANEDGANAVNALEIMQRIERIIQYRLDMEARIPDMTIDEIDSLCIMYSTPRSGDYLDFDQPDDSEHPLVVDHSNLLEIVQAANNSVIDSYIEQLAEIQNGACPQGRTTRLFQIYTSFY